MATSADSVAPKPLKIYIHTFDGAGNLNACIGISQALAKRGHKISFLINIGFKGWFEQCLLYRICCFKNNAIY